MPAQLAQAFWKSGKEDSVSCQGAVVVKYGVLKLQWCPAWNFNIQHLGAWYGWFDEKFLLVLGIQ